MSTSLDIPINEKRWLSPQDVAELGECSYKTVMRAIWARRLVAVQRMDHGPWRIRRDWAAAWVRGEVITTPLRQAG